MSVRIGLIIPYYGKWPRFFELYLKSCSYNNWFDIIFVTDLELPASAGENIRKIHMSMDELRTYFSDKLNVPIKLDSYYKLCDLKPTYGYVFNDYLKDYDFWAFGDIDLVYGNTRKFLTNNLFSDYDIVTFRTEWISGALTFFRNTDQVNMLFMESPDWRKVVTTSQHFSFTECAKFYKEVSNGLSVFDIPAEIVPMTAVCKKAAMEGRIRYFEKKFIKESISKNQVLTFDSSGIRDNDGNEYLHYHYITEKSKWFFSFPAWKNIPDKFYITETGFYTTNQYPFIRVLSLYRKIKNKILK